MPRYALSANYIQWKENDQSKRFAMYIDGRSKATSNIAGFTNSTRPRYFLVANIRKLANFKFFWPVIWLII